jgi:hypothetical protein
MNHHASKQTGSAASDLTTAQKLLLETLAGHFAWLEAAHPRKARSAAARKAKSCVIAKLRSCGGRRRAAA